LSLKEEVFDQREVMEGPDRVSDSVEITRFEAFFYYNISS
jgi:hypothetical protein